MTRQVLVADIGGTNFRFAVANLDGAIPRLSKVHVMPTPSGNFSQIAAQCVETLGVGSVAGAAVAAAGRIRGSSGNRWIELTNANLRIDQATLSKAIKGNALLANDLEAVAAALPMIHETEIVHIGTSPIQPGHQENQRLVVGVGTGFGAATLGRDGLVSGSEAGHADIAAVNADEQEVLQGIGADRRTSVEYLLSGQGLPRLASVVMRQEMPDVQSLLKIHAQGDEGARKTMAVFSRWLGRTVGNLVLAHGAWGGAFLIGGVLEGLGKAFDQNLFREGFEDKGPFASDLREVRTCRIVHPQPALVGMSVLSQRAHCS